VSLDRATERYPYEITSHWRVAGRIDDVWVVLTDASSLPRWWRHAYSEVSEVSPGDASGRGRIADVVTRGFLPYAVRWRVEVTESRRPELLRIKASGDVAGLGEWRLFSEAGAVRLTYDWRVSVGKPWMRRFEPVLKPVFAINHNWVMRKGELGLRTELARRARRVGR
jgi:hypothetical protein